MRPPLKDLRPPFVPAMPAVLAVLFAVCVGAAGCSPTYNWREVGFADAGLAGLLPCKPDRAEKPVALSNAGNVTLEMMGCVAGGATFTLSHIHLGPETETGNALDPLVQWQSATAARLKVPLSGAEAFAPPGAAVLPGSVKFTFNAPGPDGKPLAIQIASFMRAVGAGRSGFDLFQAAIHGGSDGAKIDPEAADNFFSSLRLR
ncbi:MAG: hypothetical protein ABI589_04430 [Burkholderiales bacterium]